MTKILIVEDNANNREMLTRRLEKLGFAIQCAVDGKTGIAKAKDWMPDVVLMDIALGYEMDGWEATAFIKADPATRHIPIIALTAHALATDRERSILAGCTDHDIKPVDLVRLLGKIERAVARESWPHVQPGTTMTLDPKRIA